MSKGFRCLQKWRDLLCVQVDIRRRKRIIILRKLSLAQKEEPTFYSAPLFHFTRHALTLSALWRDKSRCCTVLCCTLRHVRPWYHHTICVDEDEVRWSASASTIHILLLTSHPSHSSPLLSPPPFHSLGGHPITPCSHLLFCTSDSTTCTQM